MKSIRDIRVQRLFLLALVLKLTSSFLGWMLGSPWLLGLAIPLLVMTAYIVLGHFRRDNDVTDDKFADTCYYLGFIFTITSIVFCLFDLPNIGTRIQDIAVRFGAAMVSTVFGLGVRVYLVSFKKDVADAINDAEDAILDATRRFTEQLNIAVERLQDFESKVDTAAKASVERVNMQVENLSKNHAEKLTTFFTELVAQNQTAFTEALGEVREASQRLSESVDGYSEGMRANLASIEAKVGAFSDAVTHRLKTTTFPDDYFARQLNEPLSQLKASSTAIADGVKATFHEVNESTVVLSAALKKLKDKAGATEDSLGTVLKLTQQQHAMLDATRGQLETMEQLAAGLLKFDNTLTSTLAGIAATNTTSSELSSKVGELISDGAETRRAVEAGLLNVVEKLQGQARATDSLAARMEANAAATTAAADAISGKLALGTTAAETASVNLTALVDAAQAVVGRLENVAVADLQAVQSLGSIGEQAGRAVDSFNGAIEQIHAMVRQLTLLDAAVQVQNEELHDVSSQIREVKTAVKAPVLTLDGSFPRQSPAPLSAFGMGHQVSAAFSPQGQPVTHPHVPSNGIGDHFPSGSQSPNGARAGGISFGSEDSSILTHSTFPPRAPGT